MDFFLGRYQLGDWVPLTVQTVNAAGTPTVPDAAPTVKIVDSSGTTTATVSLPIIDKFHTTAYFAHRIQLTSSYAAGTYMVIITWATGSGAFSGQEYGTFDVVAGGNADGAVIGSNWFETQEAGQLVYQLDGGKLLAGRNPR